jgi:ribosome-associated protein
VLAITTDLNTETVTPPAAPTADTGIRYKFALAAAEMAANTRCTNVTLLDLRGRSPVAEFFVIATGTSAVQMRTVADEVSDLGDRMNYGKFQATGYDGAKWIIVDFVHVVVHVFDQASRDFYGLEELWNDAPAIDWRKELGLPADFATAPVETSAPFSVVEVPDLTESIGDALEEAIEEDEAAEEALAAQSKSKPKTKTKAKKASVKKKAPAKKKVAAKKRVVKKKAAAKPKKKPAVKKAAAKKKPAAKKKKK